VVRVDFYYGIGSRYSYLAASQVASIETETGCSIEWHPINSERLLSLRGSSPFEGEPVSGQYDWTYREKDAKRWAALYGIPYVEPRGRIRIDPELLALACTAAKRLGNAAAYSRQLFAAVFCDDLRVVDEAECARRADPAGFSISDFSAELASPQTKIELDRTIGRAIGAGVFGVPTFVVDNELFWGNDRIPLLRRHLSGLR